MNENVKNEKNFPMRIHFLTIMKSFFVWFLTIFYQNGFIFEGKQFDNFYLLGREWSIFSVMAGCSFISRKPNVV